MILNTNILPSKVVNTTVTTAVNPNDSIDLCHKIMPGIVANALNIRPSGGNIYKAKATTISVRILSTVALGYILENKFATPILFLTIPFILTSLKLLYNYWQPILYRSSIQKIRFAIILRNHCYISIASSLTTTYL